jgi:hypothetical protein
MTDVCTEIVGFGSPPAFNHRIFFITRSVKTVGGPPSNVGLEGYQYQILGHFTNFSHYSTSVAKKVSNTLWAFAKGVSKNI